MMNKFFYIGLFLSLALLCTACIKENLEDCETGLKLSFDFSHHTEEPGNRFGPNVEVIRVYCFDEQGILRHIQQGSGEELTNDYVMDVNLAPGKYTIISWGGNREQFFNSYHEADFTKAPNPTKKAVIGETTFDQFRVILNSIPAIDLPEQIVPHANEIDDLYYGAVGARHPQSSTYNYELIEVKTGVVVKRTIALIRDTNILKVSVTGINHLESAQPSDFRLWTVTRNSEYLSDNTIAENTQIIRYTPYFSTTTATSINTDIKILRMDMYRHKTEPILLYVETSDGQKLPGTPIDVVNTLLLARDPKTNEYIYNSQSDFDKIYEHPIELRLGADLGLTIFIGEWEVVYVKPA